MRKILLTGMPGSGKSTIAQKLNSKEFTVIDSDTISHWVDENGEPVVGGRPANTPLEWLETHAWVWDKEKIQQLLGQSHEQPLVICGYSWDLNKHYRFFDQIIFLTVDPETTRQRLLTRTNGNVFGKGIHELSFLLSQFETFENTAKNAGAVTIDATRPLEQVVEEVTLLLKPK